MKLLITPREHDKMAGGTRSVKGFLVYLLTPILSKIIRETTIEDLIDLHQVISGNTASMASNLGGGRHGHPALMMTAEKYMEQTGYTFVPPNNPNNYPQTTVTA